MAGTREAVAYSRLHSLKTAIWWVMTVLTSKGVKTIGHFHQQLFNIILKGSRLVGKIKDVRFLTKDVAIMHAVGGTIMDRQMGIEPERNSIHTIVANRDNPNAGQWFITAFQNTRTQYIGRPQEIQTLTEELRKEFGQ